jgi:hypothetical protein
MSSKGPRIPHDPAQAVFAEGAIEDLLRYISEKITSERG